MLLLFAKRPITGLNAQRHIHGASRSKVCDLVHDVVVFDLQDDLAQVKLAMHQAGIMGEVQPLGQLNRYIENVLDVAPRHINRQVQIKSLDVLEDASTIVGLDHGKMTLSRLFNETVKRSYNIRMRLKVDPFGDVFLVRYLSNDKLLAKILMVDYKRRVAHHVLDLNKIKKCVEKYMVQK